MAAIHSTITKVTNLVADIPPTHSPEETAAVRRLLESSTFAYRFSSSEHPCVVHTDYSIITKPLNNSRNAFIGLLMVLTLWYGEMTSHALIRLVQMFDKINNTRFMRFLEQA